MRPFTWLAVGLALVVPAIVGAAKPARGIHPLAAVYSGGQGKCFGGSVDGAWKDEMEVLPRVRGGETYRVYTPNRYLGGAVGGRPDPNGPGVGPEFGWLPVSMKLPAALDRSLKHTGAFAIGICGDWDALPRVPRPVSPKGAAYRSAVRRILKANGLPKEPVNITEALRIDLEGDGTDEVILSATTPHKDFPSFHSQKGDYSLVVIRKLVRGKVVTIPLGQNHCRAAEPNVNSAPYRYCPEAVLDLNGDGVLEIVIGWTCWEGSGHVVCEVKGRRAKDVLSWGWQA